MRSFQIYFIGLIVYLISVLSIITLVWSYDYLFGLDNVEDEPDVPPQFYREPYFKYRIDRGWPTKFDEKIPVLEFKIPLRGEDHIIFLETSCATRGPSYEEAVPELRLSYQKVCAIESAAKTNPRFKIYLFYTCPLSSSSLHHSSYLIQQLFTNKNIHVWHETMTSFFNNSPLQPLYESGDMDRSKYRSSHASDVLRYLALWKFGGIYLDLDFIVVRSLDGLGKNFAGAEDVFYIASGATGLSADSVGREIAEACVEELRTNFRGDIWNHNGPGVMTRIMEKRCGTTVIASMTSARCRNFTVHPPPVFYAIPHGHWKGFFRARDSDAVMAKLNESYAVHLWNSKSKIEYEMFWKRISKEMLPGTRQPVALLRKKYCPGVYKHIVWSNKMLRR